MASVAPAARAAGAPLVAQLRGGRSAGRLLAQPLATWTAPRQRRPRKPTSLAGAAATIAAAAGASATGVMGARRGGGVRATACAPGASTVEALDFRQGMGAAAAAQIGSGVEVVMVPCLSDNYAPILHDPATGATAVVDTPEVGPILEAIEKRGWRLTHILNTHHHYDHAGGNAELKKKTGCKIIGPAGEAHKIPGIDVPAGQGDKVQVGSLEAEVLEVGGHTLGHVAYHFPQQKLAFVGDALFVLGCGRMFEGTPAQFWESLSKLRALPDDTVVYCAHEYTQTNARFAVHFGGVPRLTERAEVISEMRAAGQATVPTLLGHEKATNPFLLADSDGVRDAAGLPEGAAPVEVWAAVRRAKDDF